MRHLLFVLCTVLCIITSKAADLSLKLDMSNSIPANEASYASLSKINMVFDLSGVDMGDYSLENCGIEATMSATRLISLYKGNPTDGELLTTIRKNVMKTGDDFKTGNSIELSFDKEYVLEPNQLYTLHIAQQTFRLTPVDAKVYWYIPETAIRFYGKEASSSELVLTGQNPSVDNPISELNVLSLTFNSNVKLSSEPIATLKDGEETLSTGVLAIDENNQNVVLADFGSQTLYVSHKYTVEIPAGTIFSSDGQVSFRDLQINLEGGSFKYFSYGRIHPKNNSELSYLTDITVPVVCDDGLALGRAKAPKAYLYKGESTKAIGEYQCVMGDDGKSWMIPVWNFSLEPASQYSVVLTKDQHKLWSLTDTGVWREVADTSNPELVLTYTTPAELEKPLKISLSGSTPTNMEACERIDNVVLNLTRYEFEGNTYDIYLANENPMAIFSDGTTETSIPVLFKNGNLSATVAVNRPLDAGKEYTLKIPANTFIPNVNENLAAVAGNDEILLTVTGKAAPFAEFVSLSYTVDGEVTLKTMVEKGKPVTVAVTVPEGRQIESVTLDGTPLSGVMDVYTIPALAEDAGVLVTLVPLVEPDPVYHNVTLSLDNAAAQTSAVEEGKTVSFQLTPVDDLWKVESVENATLDEASGMYVTEPVKADIEVKATFALVNPVDFNFTTEVEEVPEGCAYSVRSEGEMLIIEGVTAGDNIRIYTTGGTLIADKTVPADMSVAAMNLAPGIYIVAINNTTLKIRH